MPNEKLQTLNTQEALNLDEQNHMSGDLPKVERIYQQILQANHNQQVALYLHGVIAHQHGKNDVSIGLIARAISIKPNYFKAHSNLLIG